MLVKDYPTCKIGQVRAGDTAKFTYRDGKEQIAKVNDIFLDGGTVKIFIADENNKLVGSILSTNNILETSLVDGAFAPHVAEERIKESNGYICSIHDTVNNHCYSLSLESSENTDNIEYFIDIVAHTYDKELRPLRPKRFSFDLFQKKIKNKTIVITNFKIPIEKMISIKSVIECLNNAKG